MRQPWATLAVSVALASLPVAAHGQSTDSQFGALAKLAQGHWIIGQDEVLRAWPMEGGTDLYLTRDGTFGSYRIIASETKQRGQFTILRKSALTNVTTGGTLTTKASEFSMTWGEAGNQVRETCNLKGSAFDCRREFQHAGGWINDERFSLKPTTAEAATALLAALPEVFPDAAAQARDSALGSMRMLEGTWLTSANGTGTKRVFGAFGDVQPGPGRPAQFAYADFTMDNNPVDYLQMVQTGANGLTGRKFVEVRQKDGEYQYQDYRFLVGPGGHGLVCSADCTRYFPARSGRAMLAVSLRQENGYWRESGRRIFKRFPEAPPKSWGALGLMDGYAIYFHDSHAERKGYETMLYVPGKRQMVLTGRDYLGEPIYDYFISPTADSQVFSFEGLARDGRKSRGTVINRSAFEFDWVPEGTNVATRFTMVSYQGGGTGWRAKAVDLPTRSLSASKREVMSPLALASSMLNNRRNLASRTQFKQYERAAIRREQEQKAFWNSLLATLSSSSAVSGGTRDPSLPTARGIADATARLQYEQMKAEDARRQGRPVQALGSNSSSPETTIEQRARATTEVQNRSAAASRARTKAILDEAYARTDAANAEESGRQMAEQARIKAKIDADLAAARARSAAATAQPRPAARASTSGSADSRAAIIVKDDRAEIAREAAEKRQREADYAAQREAQAAAAAAGAAKAKAERDAAARKHKPLPPCKTKYCAKPA